MKLKSKKKPCSTCGHGIAIHHPDRRTKRSPCWFPGCKCGDYKFEGDKTH